MRSADAAIGETRAAFVAALRAGDPVAAASVYTEQARLVPPWAELLRGRAAIQAFWRAGIGAGISDAALDPLSLDRHGGFAYELGRYGLWLRDDDGAIVVDRGTYLLVHERQADESWRWAVEMFNPEPPPESPAAGARPGRGPALPRT